jgi:molybdenum cofactor guanylyltransferase
MKITGIILAGGNSSRMGRDKGLVNFHQKPMVEYVISILEPLCSSILISTSNSDYSRYGYPLVADDIEDLGPIGGLLSSIRRSETELNIILPCDMPLITDETIKSLINSNYIDRVTILKDEHNNIWPLCGIYPNSVIPAILRQIIKGCYSIKGLLDQVQWKAVFASNLKGQLANINDPADLLRLEETV